MKIIHCLIQYMPLHMAGTEVYTHTLATIQKSSGQEVAVITPHIEYYLPGQMNSHYQYDGIDVYQFLETANPRNRDIYSGKKKPEGLDNFLSLLQQLQPDVVHFHELNKSIGFTIEHVKIAKQYGAKVFVTMHLSFYTCNTNQLIKNKTLCNGKINPVVCAACSYQTMFSFPPVAAYPTSIFGNLLTNAGITNVLKKGKLTTLVSMPAAIRRIKKELMQLANVSDQLICLTEWYKKILLLNEVPAHKITVIPQALATNSPQVDFNTRQFNHLPIRIIFLGRIQAQKGVHLLIEACKHFTPDKILVDIYGKEESDEYFKNCVRQSTSISSIRWMGAIQRNNVMETLCKYDLLCLPSMFSEMSPLVIQEAFAAGLPVLASKVYGNIEQIKDGKNGMLFNFGSSTHLRDKIEEVLSNPALLNQFKKHIQPPNNFKTVAAKYLSIYTNPQ